MFPGFSDLQGVSASPDPTLFQAAVYACLIFAGVMALLTFFAVLSLPVFFATVVLLQGVLGLANNSPDPVGKLSKVFGLVFRSLRRNVVRTSLTYVALFVLTGMLATIYSGVALIDNITKEKEDNVQVIMTERFGAPSMMPRSYPERLKGILRDLPADARPRDIDKDFMVWSFVGASLDLGKRTQENTIFMLATDPDSVVDMLSYQGLSEEDLGDEYPQLVAAVAEMKKDKRNIVVGPERLDLLGKKVGDTIKAYALGYSGVSYDLHIVGSFPESATRWAKSALMRRDYFNDALDAAKMTGPEVRPVNLVWVRMPNKAAYEKLASVVNDPQSFSAPQAKLETASAAIGSFLEGLKSIVFAFKYIIMPAIAVIMCLVVGITITIGVRERRSEMAVMKVLGFLPWQVMGIIIAEAVLIGVMGGLLSTWLVYFLPKTLDTFKAVTGLKFKILFFDKISAPYMITVYGPLLGTFVGLIGSALPAISSRKVKVSEVFAQVT
jgi:putative ABC transport system permease protein